MLTDDQLLQYSRHLMLPEVDAAGQACWLNSSVLIVGLGGLGSPVALYLATAGVGKLLLVDDDRVELSNLQRQIIHTQARIDDYKVDSAKQAIADVNPLTQVEAFPERLEEARMQELVASVDLVIDCSDNFKTRHALNRVCRAQLKPLVSGAAIRFEGQVSVFDPRVPEAPCYECLYPPDSSVEQNCSNSGVFAPLVGIVGTIQAAEALKVLANVGQPSVGRLLLIDALRMEFHTVKLPKKSSCEVCGD